MPSRLHIVIAILLAILALAVTACASAAEIRPVPLDHDTLDLGNGVYGLFVRGADRVEKTGFFTAVLYKQDHYDGEQIRNLAPGDTVYANDRKWTVKEVVVHSNVEAPDVPTDYEIYTEEDLGEGYECRTEKATDVYRGDGRLASRDAGRNGAGETPAAG